MERQPLLERPEKTSRTCCVSTLSVITVEPVLFLSYIAFGFYSATDYALIYNKTCLSFYRTDVCDNIQEEEFSQQEYNVQKTASQWRMYLDLCYLFPTTISIAIQGYWSDRFGRKLPIVVPLLGEFIAHGARLYNSVYMDGKLEWLLLPFLIQGIFGGRWSLLMAVFSYLSDVSSKESRLLRIAIAEAVMYTSTGIGNSLSGLIVDQFGLVSLYLLCEIVLTVTLVYIFICVEEIIPKQKENTVKDTTESFLASSYKDRSQDSLRIKKETTNKDTSDLLGSVNLDKTIIISSGKDQNNQHLCIDRMTGFVHVMVLLRRREGHLRANIIICIVACCLIMLTDSKYIV